MNPKNSQDLFNKIRSQFTNIRLGDENGAATADPSSAVFFEFEFKEDADTFGSVSVSIAEDGTMKVFYNRNLVDKIDEDSKDEWYAFLKELKDFAIEHQLSFDVRDITKTNLTKQDYKNLADTNQTVNNDEMHEELDRITKLAGIEVKESLTGTSRRSYENLDQTRLIIRHKGKVDETVPGARSRQIQSLYIENEDGERFKYPITHLAGARAMARHVANGGRPHDEFGEHIVQTSEDIAKLNSFSRYVTNKDQLNDNAGDIIEQTKMKLENLRTYVKGLAKQSHYEAASKGFKTAEEQILDDETVNKMREKFTMKNLDSRVEDALPLINRIMSEFEKEPKEAPVTELGIKEGHYPHAKNFQELYGIEFWNQYKDMANDAQSMDAEEFNDTYGSTIDMANDFWADHQKQVNELDPGEEPIDAPIQPDVDHGAIVQSFLTDPDNKLVLRRDDSADKMLAVTKFKDKNTMLGSILSDIASRLISKDPQDDRVANFASRVADGIEQEGMPMFKPGPDYNSNKKIAVQLARRYVDDYKKMKDDPEYKDEVRKDPQDINKFKNIKGQSYGDKSKEYGAKEAEDFVEWADNVTTEYDTKPRDQEDRRAKLKALQDIQMTPGMMNDPGMKAAVLKRRHELKKDDGLDNTDRAERDHREISRIMKYEDIKPYIEQHLKDGGDKATAIETAMAKFCANEELNEFDTAEKKAQRDALMKSFMAKGGKVEKVPAGKTAYKGKELKPAYKKDNETPITSPGSDEGMKESRTKIVEAIKAKADGDNAQNIAGVEEEITRITQLAHYH